VAVGKASLQRAAELNSKDDNSKLITETLDGNGAVKEEIITSDKDKSQSKIDKKTSVKKKGTSKETQSTSKKVTTSKTTSSKKSSKTKESTAKGKVNDQMQDDRQISKIHSDLPVHLL